jgi:hydrogenase nickel incorporation protein HypB
VEFDGAMAYENIQAVRPGMQVFQVSSKTGEGMAQYLDFLTARLADVRPAAAV